MLARKGLFIVLLISLILGYFYFKPFLSPVEEEPELADRLPVGDFLGKVYVLDVARETNSFLYYNKLPFRDFLTYEFLLAQGKNYGLDLQKPLHFFANEDGEWGSLLTLNDSSKIISGINRIRQNFDLEDTLVGGQKVTKIANQNLYMTYGKKWLFIYHGSQLPKRMYHVIYSKKNDIHASWKDFNNNKQFSNESVVVYSNSPKIQKHGIETALFSFDCDSIQVNLKTYLKSKEMLNLSIKDSGMALLPKNNMDKNLSLHLNVSKLRNNPRDPLVKWISKISKRISFPINDFLKAWEGDLTFQEGGTQSIKESYIETEFDDEFNATEVRKTKDVLVPGYSVLLSMNSFQKEFVSKMFAKGIMRKENNRFHILTSPPLHINQKPTYLMLYSADRAPKITINKDNRGYWSAKRTKYYFNLDSLNTQEVFFSVNFPAISLFRKNIFF
ncbi:MAG: hypothetical protein V4622_03795 [Bacteroidota bacterium]